MNITPAQRHMKNLKNKIRTRARSVVLRELDRQRQPNEIYNELSIPIPQRREPQQLPQPYSDSNYSIRVQQCKDMPTGTMSVVDLVSSTRYSTTTQPQLRHHSLHDLNLRLDSLIIIESCQSTMTTYSSSTCTYIYSRALHVNQLPSKKDINYVRAERIISTLPKELQ